LIKEEEKRSKSNIFTTFIKDNIGRYASGVLLLVLINSLQLAVPKITGNAVNSVVYNSGNATELFTYSGIILAIALLVFILHYLSRLQLIGASNLFDFLLRNKMFERLTLLPAKFYVKNGVGDLMALSVNDIRAIRIAMGRGVIIFTNTLVLMVASVIIMSNTMDLKMTMLLITPFPLLIYIILKFGIVINKRYKKVQESFANLTRKVQENISGIRVVKAFAQEESEILNFSKINYENYRINMNLVKVHGVFSPFIGLILNLSYLAVLFYGGLSVIQKSITIGDFIVFNSYVAIILRPVRMIGRIVSIVQRGKASYERINELFTEETVESENLNGDSKDLEESNKKLKGRVEFKNLSFSYNVEDKEALKNINLVIEPGMTLGIVGRIGSGKTTLANLLLRLYEVNEKGRIFIDDIDIKDIPHQVLRNNIGYVPQENILFSQSIRENIAFSPKKFSMEEVVNAAKISQIYDDIVEFPDGFDSLLGERGTNISGGQKQRISIARALIKDSPILILDDCLSAVDTNTEKMIIKDLKKSMKNRTCIIIAHRLSIVTEADEIIVLDKGEIIERGTHEELLNMRGYYSRMYERQLLEEKVSNL
jgi:ATP-binding cassette subfamily B multidrug efflux pump